MDDNLVSKLLVGKPVDRCKLASVLRDNAKQLESDLGAVDVRLAPKDGIHHPEHIKGVRVFARFLAPPSFDQFFGAQDYLEELLEYRVYLLSEPSAQADSAGCERPEAAAAGSE